jgi:hypothetical protein
MASCRAWFAASALSVEKGFCLPVAVGLGGRGITTTSSSVGSGVGFASPQCGQALSAPQPDSWWYPTFLRQNVSQVFGMI